MRNVLRWSLDNYTLIAVYLLIAAFAWRYDVSVGIALAALLPLAFGVGRESMREQLTRPSSPAPHARGG